jgi:hypothetical protein
MFSQSRRAAKFRQEQELPWLSLPWFSLRYFAPLRLCEKKEASVTHAPFDSALKLSDNRAKGPFSQSRKAAKFRKEDQEVFCSLRNSASLRLCEKRQAS